MTSTWSTNTKKDETEFNYLFYIAASLIEENEYYSVSDQNRW